MSMEEIMIFLKFKDSGEDLNFTFDQLLKASLHIWAKLNPPQIRKLEEEGKRIKDEESRDRDKKIAAKKIAEKK